MATNVQTPAVVETHLSYLFFVGDRVYKLKKTVATDFVDLTAVEARQRVCQAEVDLNRRLAPDAYLGVAQIAGPDGEVCEPLVVMRRMPPDRCLSRLVCEDDSRVPRFLDQIADVMAAFHARAARSTQISQAGTVPALLAHWDANTAALRAFGLIDQARVDRVGRLAHRYLHGRTALIQDRIDQHQVVDGHGDLLADDIFCLDDGPRILDCLEFDAHLRHGDTLADMAFLAMDLERLNRPDLAARLLRRYQQTSGDAWPDSLVHHWTAYRAQVRAKVACLRATQGGPAEAARAERLLALAVAHLEVAIPRLVLVGGLPGTGKSTVARGIGEARHWPVLRSDVVRKQLAGLDPLVPAGASYQSGLYRAEVSAETYAVLLGDAAARLGRGESVVLDASWTDQAWRRAATDVAAASGSVLVPLRCHTPHALAARRIAARAAHGGDPSDATVEIAGVMALNADPWPRAVTINTGADIPTTLGAALAAVDRQRP